MAAGQRAAARAREQYAPGLNARRVGKELQQNQRVFEDAQNARANQLEAQGRKLSKPEQAALRVVAEGQSIEKRIEFHKQQIAAGVGNARDHRAQVALLKRAMEYVDNVGGRPTIAAGNTRLGRLYGVMRDVGAQREAILRDTGQLSEEGINLRVQAPGRVIAGARYEAPTPGKLGQPSQGLIRARARVDRLQTLYERAVERQRPPAPKEPTAQDRAAETARWNKEDARATASEKARLAKIDSEYNTIVDRVAEAVNPYDNPKAVQLRRNYVNSRVGKGKFIGTRRQPTVKNEARSLAETKLAEMVAQHPDSPVATRYAALAAEREMLQRRINARAERAFEAPDSGPARAIPRVGIATRPTSERIGSALSVAKDELARIEAAAAKRVKPTGLVGGEKFDQGEVYVPYYKSEPRIPANAPRQGVGGVVGRTRGLISQNKPFTGSALEHGQIPDRTTRLVAAQARRANRYLASDRFRQQLIQAGHDERRSVRDVLVNDRTLRNPTVPPEIKAALGKERLTLDELSGHEIAHAAFLKQLFPMSKPNDYTALTAEERNAAQLGATVPGYKWVDEGLLRGLNKPVRGLGPVGKGMDVVNRAVRLALLEFKPAYLATIGLSNLGMNLLQHHFNPFALARSAHLWRSLSSESKVRALAGMGEGFLESAATGSRLAMLRDLEKAIIRRESKVINTPSRMLSFGYEAWRQGYRTPEAVHRLLTDPALERQRASVFRRGKNAVIDFGRLSDRERAYLSRIAFFYPWIKGATIWAGHTALEHPVFTGTLANAGKVGARAQLNRYGQPNAEGIKALPEALQGALLTGPASAPRAYRFGAINVAQTPVDFAKALTGKTFDPSSLLTPALSIPLGEITRQNIQTGQTFPKNEGFLQRQWDLLKGFLPQEQAIQRAGGAGRLAQGFEAIVHAANNPPATNQEARHLFPYTPRDAAMKYLLGGIASAPVNPQKAATQVLKEQLQSASPAKRAVLDVQVLRQSMIENAKKLGAKTALPPEVDQALKWRARITSSMAKLGQGAAPLDKLEAAMTAAKFPAAAEKEWLAAGHKAYKVWPQDHADKYVRHLISTIERRFYQTVLMAAVKELNAAGGDVQYAPAILP